MLISHQICINHYDVYSDCENPFPSGCCSIGTAFVCDGVNLTHAHELTDEIPQSCTNINIANAKNSFISNGDWKFLSNLTNLRELSFFNTKISSLWDLKSVYIKNLGKLKRFSLAFGELQIFPGVIFTKLSSLRYLNLKCNMLQDIGDGNWNFSSLNTLFLNNNRITAVTAGQFKGLRNLSKLDLSYNRIGYFSLKVLDCMPNLQYLILSFNRLAYLSEYIGQNLNLESIFLHSNQFESFDPFVYNGFKSLKFIDFHNNNIKDSPNVNSIKNLTSLMRLSLSVNAIKHLTPLFFDSFPCLHKASVAHNGMHYIDETTFRSVPNLTSIIMAHNQIHTIPRQLFQHLQKLDIIELQFNRIQIFDPIFLNHLSPQVQLFIDGNPLVCDCQAVPLLKWLRQSETPPHLFPECRSPTALQNQSIYYAELPQDCSNTTGMTVYPNDPTTLYPSEPGYDEYTLYLYLIAGTFIMMLMCICYASLRFGRHGAS
ncbi:Leucine-rich repeat-containing protein 15 [Holothuria leucospilota]|uniref:Leucine-rich repeat-containing protein 15 n=1 Tax=Holothuria leucospilota TaxID=206669 RepID=A0A9Q1CRC4_HOLLE|nr:Leucine-rich repeat-containing protein 15 [Holothuria leucospilota]